MAGICDGSLSVLPACMAIKAITAAPAFAIKGAFEELAQGLANAASEATVWLWNGISDATVIDIGGAAFQKDMAVTMGIAASLTVLLFVVQVVASALRREPGGLGRALSGLFISLVGSVFAISVVRLLLAAVDALCNGIVQATMGTDLAGLGKRLPTVALLHVSSPGLTLMFSVLMLASVVICWAALTVRKLLIIVAAVMSPLAFSGATADITRGWVRRWIEFVLALIASKLLLVLVLMTGISMLDGVGIGTNPTPTQVLTQVATSVLLLFLGGLAPWAAIKVAHIGGEAMQAAHMSVSSATVGGHMVINAPMKMASTAATVSSGAGAAAKLASTAAPKSPPRVDPPAAETPSTSKASV